MAELQYKWPKTFLQSLTPPNHIRKRPIDRIKSMEPANTQFEKPIYLHYNPNQQVFNTHILLDADWRTKLESIQRVQTFTNTEQN